MVLSIWPLLSNIWKTLDFMVNEYTISDSYSMMKLVGHPMTWLFDRCTDKFEIFSRFLAKVEVDFWCIPGGGGDSHMKQTGMLVGNVEFNP